MQAILTKTVKDKTVKIYQDQDAESPRAWSTFGKILYFSSKYVLGDEKGSPEEIADISNDDDMISIPVYAYIHSCTKLVASESNPFHCQWDSGQSGIIYVSKDQIRKEFGRLTKKNIEKAVQLMKSEVETFSQYLNGDVYGYQIENEKGEHIDSCWGFMGYDIEELADDALAGKL